jgi:hypothetical protein
MFILILQNISVRTSKKTRSVTITDIIWLMLFRETIAVYSENHTTPINTFCGRKVGLLLVKSGGKLHIVTTMVNGFKPSIILLPQSPLKYKWVFLRPFIPYCENDGNQTSV